MPIQHGSKELRDKDGNPVRADIVVYASKAACLNRDQGKINFVVECKRNKVEDGYAQLVSYIFNTSANGGVWTNGMVTARSSTGERTRTAFKSSRRPPVCRGAVKDGRMGGLRA